MRLDIYNPRGSSLEDGLQRALAEAGEAEPLATRADGRQEPIGALGQEQEVDPRAGLLQRLEQSVGRLRPTN